MLNITDLNIEQEISPFFEFTQNHFTKKVLIDLLMKPLASKEEILERQHTLRGFIKNHDILKGYSYSYLYLIEVRNFFDSFNSKEYEKEKGILQFFVSSNKKNIEKGKFAQVILFFHKIYSNYFSKLDSIDFSKEYSEVLIRIKDFLESFELEKYNSLLKKDVFSYKHILKLADIISEKQKDSSIIYFWADLFSFEAHLSISLGIQKHDFVFPEFSKEISLQNFYHPLLKNPILNNFETKSNVIILTGPNMAGKSTLLKSIALCVYLAHLGFAIPASKGKVPFYASFSIAINHNDNLESGYSHFMTELINLKLMALDGVNGKPCFGVFDELFKGTNEEDALEISIKTILGLAKFKNSLFFISTHLNKIQEINILDKDNISPYYVDCKLNGNKPNFTYKLSKGWSNLKIGKILFDNEGLNEIFHS